MVMLTDAVLLDSSSSAIRLAGSAATVSVMLDVDVSVGEVKVYVTVDDAPGGPAW